MCGTRKSLAIAMVALSTINLSAQEKTFEREYTYVASEMDSKISCRAVATNQLRIELLNEIGVYIENEQLLKSVEVDGEFSQDFVENMVTLTAGITKLEVLEERWNGETFWMKAAITIDKKSLEESLTQLIQDRQKEQELEALKQELTATTAELDRLKKETEREPYGNNPKEKKTQDIRKLREKLIGSPAHPSGDEQEFDIKNPDTTLQEKNNTVPMQSNEYFNSELKTIHSTVLSAHEKIIQMHLDFIRKRLKRK
jgi:hypothetical protein